MRGIIAAVYGPYQMSDPAINNQMSSQCADVKRVLTGANGIRNQNVHHRVGAGDIVRGMDWNATADEVIPSYTSAILIPVVDQHAGQLQISRQEKRTSYSGLPLHAGWWSVHGMLYL